MSEPRPGLLCVHPHPDDEAIACGGVLARYAREGLLTAVVTCTGGEEGENQGGIDLGGRSMGEVRAEELDEALDILGVAERARLGYRDSGMAGTPTTERPDCFHQADVDEAAARLAALIRAFRPAVIVSDDERGTYGHPDHVKAHIVTKRAVELAADPTALEDAGPAWQVAKRYVHALPKDGIVEMHTRLLELGLPSPFGTDPIPSEDGVPFGTPSERITTVVDVVEQLETKRSAMAAHRSQIGADSFFLNLPDEIATEVFGREAFVLEDGNPGADLEDDLFAGLR